MMQIMTALPQLRVSMPANIQVINDLIIGIANAKVVPSSTLHDVFVKPVFADSEEKDSSLLEQVIWMVLVVAGISLLIALVICCKVKIVPRCGKKCHKVVQFIKAKLMFNSLIRACL